MDTVDINTLKLHKPPIGLSTVQFWTWKIIDFEWDEGSYLRSSQRKRKIWLWIYWISWFLSWCSFFYKIGGLPRASGACVEYSLLNFYLLPAERPHFFYVIRWLSPFSVKVIEFCPGCLTQPRESTSSPFYLHTHLNWSLLIWHYTIHNQPRSTATSKCVCKHDRSFI